MEPTSSTTRLFDAADTASFKSVSATRAILARASLIHEKIACRKHVPVYEHAGPHQTYSQSVSLHAYSNFCPTPVLLQNGLNSPMSF